MSTLASVDHPFTRRSYSVALNNALKQQIEEELECSLHTWCCFLEIPDLVDCKITTESKQVHIVYSLKKEFMRCQTDSTHISMKHLYCLCHFVMIADLISNITLRYSFHTYLSRDHLSFFFVLRRTIIHRSPGWYKFRPSTFSTIHKKVDQLKFNGVHLNERSLKFPLNQCILVGGTPEKT